MSRKLQIIGLVVMVVGFLTIVGLTYPVPEPEAPAAETAK